MKLGFIGTGNMASAIMGGIIKNNVIPAEEIIGADLFAPGRERAQKEYGINVTADNKEVASKAETIILSVKPQFYASVIADIKDVVTDNQIIITIAPGKTLAWLAEQFGKEVFSLLCSTLADIRISDAVDMSRQIHFSFFHTQPVHMEIFSLHHQHSLFCLKQYLI
jgi:pyrroline-5-carboxylate reductase